MFVDQSEYAQFAHCYPWAEDKQQTLSRQYQTGKLPHALMIHGPKGLGKMPFALDLARLVLCENGQQQGQACGACKQCKLFEANTHSDFKLIQPEEEGKIIKVDLIRSLSDFIYQSSLQGGMKVAIISPAENLNINAANALLKTLEEPADRSLLILVCHSAGQLLPTIRSRCQMVEMPLPSSTQSMAWVKTQTSLEEKGVDQLLTMAAGAPLQARALAEIGALEEIDSMLSELAGVLKRSICPSVIAERWGNDLAEQRLKWMLSWINKIIRLHMCPEEKGDEHKVLAYLSGKASAAQLYDLYDESLVQLRLLSGTSNPNKVLLFEHLLGLWVELMRK